jgi:hypothetical protein
MLKPNMALDPIDWATHHLYTHNMPNSVGVRRLAGKNPSPILNKDMSDLSL